MEINRRHFLGQTGISIGAAALAELLHLDLMAQSPTPVTPRQLKDLHIAIVRPE